MAVLTLPCHRHHQALDPGCIFAAVSGSRRGFIHVINLHAVRFGAVGELGWVLHDGVLRFENINMVIDHAAVMSHPLPAGDGFVLDRIAKGTAHTTLEAGKADAIFNCRSQVLASYF